ncbi:HD-GYP domain-containing protein [Calidithermus roseus]|uniref:Cyclic di-GMP phosphodiesterase response regulator RpfG n=1 Tax=Calidithermus roseus TaxID=1644118 RepID=A0A399ESZ3_9DEIN|nr:HD-GYP domain-containing protein [Calidithermus roseus]RIH85722.1 Cyclic di-GMP phosphodiesterase response regulator RpfG [Calidithermus roseus]
MTFRERGEPEPRGICSEGGRVPRLEGFAHLVDGSAGMVESLVQLAQTADLLVQSDPHAARVSQLTQSLALQLGLSSEQSARMAQAALFHDLGKLLIDPQLLDKPTRLEAQEFEVVKTHTHLGAAILSLRHGSQSSLVVSIALAHHERWDGAGYPRQLSAAQIPLEGRIVAVADTFDALLTHRPYKAAWPLPRVLEEIARQAGKQFDPEVVAALMRLAHDRQLPLLEPGAPGVAMLHSPALRSPPLDVPL